MAIAYIALGSNLERPQQQVTNALNAIAALPHSQLQTSSPWYRSKAVGPGQQPDYINGACVINTDLQPLPLLHALQKIEQQQGRVRNELWGARTLDLDILLYDNLQLDTEELQIPHPRMTERNFVLFPLADINNNLTLPDGRKLQELLANCPHDGIVRADSTT